jgi:hypothetical protein
MQLDEADGAWLMRAIVSEPTVVPLAPVCTDGV